jgi:hypothetical protein
MLLSDRQEKQQKTTELIIGLGLIDLELVMRK